MASRLSSVLGLGLAAAASAAGAPGCAQVTNGTVPAAAWPQQHTRLEQMYTPLTGPEWSSKPIWYDYPNRHYRADSFFESGNRLERLSLSGGLRNCPPPYLFSVRMSHPT